MTWADDDHQYTSWGDGGGFGGTNSDGRVGLGVARVEGTSADYTGHNVWGGKTPENPATFDGKSYGIISIEGVLYKWVSPGSGAQGYIRQTLYRSLDHGASWTAASWTFVQSEEIVAPTFAQFGKDYAGAIDGYVYQYVIRLKDASNLKVQKPGQIDLIRVPADRLMDRDAYEFFAGLDGSGSPTWSSDLDARVPVFEDALGVGWNVSVGYNVGLGRFILCTEHDSSFHGNLGIFDAPAPWGPWTTVGYYSDWQGFGSTFFWNFAPKWLSADGLQFTLVFTGTGDNDSWNSVRGSFSTSAVMPPDAGPALDASSEPVDAGAVDAGDELAPDAGANEVGGTEVAGGCALATRAGHQSWHVLFVLMLVALAVRRTIRY